MLLCCVCFCFLLGGVFLIVWYVVYCALCWLFFSKRCVFVSLFRYVGCFVLFGCCVFVVYGVASDVFKMLFVLLCCVCVCVFLCVCSFALRPSNVMFCLFVCFFLSYVHVVSDVFKSMRCLVVVCVCMLLCYCVFALLRSLFCFAV